MGLKPGMHTMTTNLDIIRATYEGSSEENGRNLLAALAPDASVSSNQQPILASMTTTP